MHHMINWNFHLHTIRLCRINSKHLFLYYFQAVNSFLFKLIFMNSFNVISWWNLNLSLWSLSIWCIAEKTNRQKKQQQQKTQKCNELNLGATGSDQFYCSKYHKPETIFIINTDKHWKNKWKSTTLAHTYTQIQSCKLPAIKQKRNKFIKWEKTKSEK